MKIMRASLCSVCILIPLLVVGVKCAEDEEDDGTPWDHLWGVVENFIGHVKKAFHSAVEKIKAQFKERAADFQGWSDEAYQSFKDALRNWIDGNESISDSDKLELRGEVEKLRMEERK